MKKRLWRLFAVVMALIFVSSVAFPVVVMAADSEKSQLSEEVIAEYEAKKAAQRNASKANELLMTYFEKNGELVFPSYYAGSYIENNEFVVCFTNAPADIEETYDRILGEYASAVRYVSRTYSIAELEEYAYALDKQLCDAGYRVTGYGVDVINNEIDMTVLNEDLAAAQAAIVQPLIEDGIRVDIYAGGYSQEATADIVRCAMKLLQNCTLPIGTEMNVRAVAERIRLPILLIE